MDCQQYLQQIAAHVDGVLAPEEVAEARAHLARCPDCQKKYEWEVAAGKALKGRVPIHEPQPFVKQKILAGLEARLAPRLWGLSLPTHGLAAAAVVLLLVVPYYVWRVGVEEQSLFSDVIASYRAVTSGALGGAPLITPSARLLDLSPWGYRLLSRRTKSVDGRSGRLFVYRGQDDTYLIAQEFDGSSFPIPHRAHVVRRNDTDFYTYQRHGVNLVAWQEKDFLCIIASSSPESHLLTLAQQIVTRGQEAVEPAASWNFHTGNPS